MTFLIAVCYKCHYPYFMVDDKIKGSGFYFQRSRTMYQRHMKIHGTALKYLDYQGTIIWEG